MEIDFFKQDKTARSGDAKQDLLNQTGASKRFTENYMQFGFDYFDNPDLHVGYGGYHYDGRYYQSVLTMIQHYELKPGARVLEVGCAKGFVLIEFHKLGFDVRGVDASEYAVSHAHPDLVEKIQMGNIQNLPFPDHTFDLVYSKEVLPHVPVEDLDTGVLECIRVSKGQLFFDIQCGESELEIKKLKEWDGTHQVMETPEWWRFRLNSLNYPGDLHFKILIPDKGR